MRCLLVQRGSSKAPVGCSLPKTRSRWRAFTNTRLLQSTMGSIAYNNKLLRRHTLHCSKVCCRCSRELQDLISRCVLLAQEPTVIVVHVAMLGCIASLLFLLAIVVNISWSLTFHVCMLLLLAIGLLLVFTWCASTCESQFHECPVHVRLLWCEGG